MTYVVLSKRNLDGFSAMQRKGVCDHQMRNWSQDIGAMGTTVTATLFAFPHGMPLRRMSDEHDTQVKC